MPRAGLSSLQARSACFCNCVNCLLMSFRSLMTVVVTVDFLGALQMLSHGLCLFRQSCMVVSGRFLPAASSRSGTSPVRYYVEFCGSLLARLNMTIGVETMWWAWCEDMLRSSCGVAWWCSGRVLPAASPRVTSPVLLCADSCGDSYYADWCGDQVVGMVCRCAFFPKVRWNLGAHRLSLWPHRRPGRYRNTGFLLT